MVHPKLVVFDLDFTLWPYRITEDAEFLTTEGKSVNIYRRKTKHYKEVPKVLDLLKQQKCQLAVASKCVNEQTAHELLRYLGWMKYFTYLIIFPQCKTEHFKTLREQSGVHYKHMLFFDDLPLNIQQVEVTGVVCYQVDHGMDLESLNNGLTKFNEKVKNDKRTGS